MPDPVPPRTEGELVLRTLLDRLMAGLLNGPAMNCRPHNSRQRIDLASLKELPGIDPAELLRAVLGSDMTAKVTTKVKGSAPRRFAKPKAKAKKVDADATTTPADAPTEPADAPVDEKDPALLAQRAVSKLRVMADDAVTYKQDTGVHVLAVGFPLLTLPPGALGKDVSRRVVAPIAFLPVDVTLTRGVSTSIEVSCYGDGSTRVIPNVALFAWLQKLVGKEDLTAAVDDESGERPLREITLLVNEVAKALELNSPDFLPANHAAPAGADAPDLELPEGFQLVSAPRTDQLADEAQILPAAVLGLFPMANQGLIEDMKALAGGEPVSGPIEGYLKSGIALDTPASPPPLPVDPKNPQSAIRNPQSPEVGPTSVNLVTDADPCQRMVVRLSQANQGVVVHGPPGTGKSQTIVNIVGDALARDQRVLFVSDKRTALDVVLNRLSFVGLGDLCAVVHDPQLDQRDLYRQIRDQLATLGEKRLSTRTGQEQQAIDEELGKLHAELTAYHRAIMDEPAPGKLSFHEMVGRWLGLPEIAAGADATALDGISTDELARLATPLRELFDRAKATDYATNPWAGIATTDIGALLARPVDEVKRTAESIAPSAEAVDATRDETAPPFSPDVDLAQQATDRVALATLLDQAVAAPAHVRQRIATLDDASLQRMAQRLTDARAMLDRVRAGPLDPSLEATARGMTNVGPADWARASGQLADYLQSQQKLLGALAFGAKNAAKSALAPFGLPLSVESASRAKAFIDAYRERVLLTFLLNELNGVQTTSNVALPDGQIVSGIGGYLVGTELRAKVAAPSLAPLREAVLQLLSDSAKAQATTAALRGAPKRVDAIEKFTSAAKASGLVSDAGVQTIRRLLCANAPIADRANDMAMRVDTLESVARLEKSLADLPPTTARPIRTLLASGLDVATATAAIEKRALAAEIRARLLANPALQQTDPQRLETMMARLVELEKQRQELLRDNVVGKWTKKARERLYAEGRLNDRGKALERRFLMSGKNALRLRKVIQQGAAETGGDPMFDLRPVWMASPETVAQLFPRKPVFDVIIFDEASQCRLEESLPVLARGRRVVVAGDEQQLPPTRFFESGLGDDDDDDGDTVATDQDLFERQQARTEDLLNASLQLQVRQAYLDVHYRSKNADLIEFSNRYFYRSRLQPIPSHPDKRPPEPPIKLYRVEGTFEKSVNEPEAKQIVEIVKELLAKKDPPSIGIACMNVQQRDEILQELDDAATEDETFGKRFDAAKERMGKGSFEGLFVKNLENVQGDERDEMIISTTYGPDKNGKFYQRFGPLQLQGGGRRLNVLVTRARSRVHLITSIPATAYRNLPAIPEGAAPTGGWLLYAYLKYAEELQEKYAVPTETTSTREAAKVEVTRGDAEPTSPLAESIATKLAGQGVGSLLNWGNPGFRVDLALRGADGAYPLGVLVDGTQFEAVDDPVGWDAFRAGVCKQQGWTLRRLWSPHLYRDPAGTLKRLGETITGPSKATPPTPARPA